MRRYRIKDTEVKLDEVEVSQQVEQGKVVSRERGIFVVRDTKDRRYTDIEGGTVRIGDVTQPEKQATTKVNTKDTSHTLTNNSNP